MTTTTIRYANGTTKTARNADDAKRMLAGEYPGCLIGHAEEQGESQTRTLVWPSEDAATNDDGRRAVAEILITE